MPYEYREHRRILLVDQNTRKLNLRATILRNHEIEVHTCETMSDAPALWKNIPYDLILMASSEEPYEVEQFAEQIRLSKPRQRIGLLVGPPIFIREISRTPGKKILSEPTPAAMSPHMPVEQAAEPQWRQLVGRVLTDWYSDHSLGRVSRSSGSGN